MKVPLTMCNSSELITLKDMAQCLSDARVLLLNKDMCPDTYVALLEEASRLINGVVAFVDGLELELDEEDEQEVDAILNHCKVVESHRHSPCFQGGDYSLYRSLQTPCSIPGLEVWELDAKAFEPLRLHDWGLF